MDENEEDITQSSRHSYEEASLGLLKNIYLTTAVGVVFIVFFLAFLLMLQIPWTSWYKRWMQINWTALLATSLRNSCNRFRKKKKEELHIYDPVYPKASAPKEDINKETSI